MSKQKAKAGSGKYSLYTGRLGAKKKLLGVGEKLRAEEC